MSRLVAFYPNRRFWLVLTLVLTVLFFVTPIVALAQDTVPPLLDVPTPDDLAGGLLNFFMVALAAVLASPVTSTVVALVKRLPIKWIQDASGQALNMSVAILLVLAVWGAQIIGAREQLDTLFKIILALGTVAVGTTFAARSSQGYYQNVASGLPILGTSRKDSAVG